MAIGFEIDPQKCTECERCMAVCSLLKFQKVLIRQASISVERNWPEIPVIRVCRFDDCEGQPCITACPVAAISKQDGIVRINREACIGCGLCVQVCPEQAIWMDGENNAYKCDFCGGDPACVKECVTGALSLKGG